MYPQIDAARSEVRVSSGLSGVLANPSGLRGGKTLENGDVLLVKVRTASNAGSGGLAASIPGFLNIHAQPGVDRVHMMLYKIVTDAASEPSSYTLTTNAPSSRIIASMEIVTGVDVNNPIAGVHGYQAGTTNPSVMSAWTVDSATDDLLIIELRTDDRVSGALPTPDVTPEGFTTTFVMQSTVTSNTFTTGARSAMWSGHRQSTGEINMPSTSVTWHMSVVSPRSSAVAFRGMPDPPDLPIGLEIVLGDGTLGYLSYIDSEGIRKAPASILVSS